MTDPRDLYIVVSFWPKADEMTINEQSPVTRERVVTDLLEGQHNHPWAVKAFNEAEGWYRDVSEDIARDVRKLLTENWEDAESVPEGLTNFLEEHLGVFAVEEVYREAA